MEVSANAIARKSKGVEGKMVPVMKCRSQDLKERKIQGTQSVGDFLKGSVKVKHRSVSAKDGESRDKGRDQ